MKTLAPYEYAHGKCHALTAALLGMAGNGELRHAPDFFDAIPAER